MTDRELLRRALDALLDIHLENRSLEQQSTIAALREALAQPEYMESWQGESGHPRFAAPPVPAMVPVGEEAYINKMNSDALRMVPMTDEEIDDLFINHGGSRRGFARAVEAHHGIGKETP